VEALRSTIARVRALPVALRFAAVAAFAVLAVATCVTGVSLHSDRVELFAVPLQPEQMTEVEEQLAAWSVPFTPVSGNVVVDVARRSDLLLRLSLAGVPHEHVETTDEVLARVGVLTPQSVIDAQTRSGLAGDIEVALRSVDGVEDARVIVAPAQNAEFADESARPATASVRLRLRSDAMLSRDAVSGIRRFVAAAVPGLEPSNVTLLDDRGVALGSSAEADASALERSLQSALDAALGAGITIVRVHTEYTTASSEERDTRRAAAGDAIAHDAQSESYRDGAKNYLKSNEHDDRGEAVEERTTHADAGAIERISTAVFVDAQRGADLAAVRALAAAAVGYDPRRGDELTVESVRFHRTLEPKRDAWFLVYGAIVPLLPTLAILVALYAAGRALAPGLRALIATALERESIARTSRTVAGYAPARVRGALAGEPPHAAAAIISALPAATAAAVLELYPPHEREAIITRMARAHGPVVPGADEVIARRA
jgi:flagellar biosynthesis/type III secretory pathway M-ring protein FliF/YscJ